MFEKIKKIFEGGPSGIFTFLSIFLLILMMLSWIVDDSKAPKLLSHSDFINSLNKKEIKTVKIDGDNVHGRMHDNSVFEAHVHMTEKIWDLLNIHNVNVLLSGETSGNDTWYFIIAIIVIFIAVIIWMVFIRPKNGGSGNSGGMSSIFSMGKSRFKKVSPGDINVKFADVAGAKNAKEALKDIIDFLKNPEKFKIVGARIPKGVLLSGEPGNGKTLLARAVAGEANCSFVSISGSEFIEVFVGVGAARIRDLFAQARKTVPCILFIDEIDAIGRTRGSGHGGGHDEREQTLNQLLTEMDGFDQFSQPLVIIAATNMPEVLDKALLRPGRFDRVVNVPYPDYSARLELLTIHSKKIILNKNVNLQEIAENTQGLSGADLENLVNLAALNATQADRREIISEDFAKAQKNLISSKRDIQIHSEHEIKQFLPQQVKIKFHDVAGLEDAKDDFKEIVDFLKNPEKYELIGARVPKGVLLSGEPGNGKTMLAKAVAGESAVPFFYASGSQFIQKYVGVGAERVRELFTQARKHAPSIIFIDEIDSIGKRSDDNSGGNSEYNQTINQLLTEMDGFMEHEMPVIVIAATNKPDALDDAMKRAGRFDRKIYIPFPNLNARRKIIAIHSKGKKFDEDFDLEMIARRTSGFSGAAIENLLNEAAIMSVTVGRTTISMKEMEEAHDRVSIGRRTIGLIAKEDELKKTAYHEAGHAILSVLQPEFPWDFYKVTILARGGTLGVSHSVTRDDETVYTKEHMFAKVIVCLGGRLAEELMFNHISTGASSDFKQATDVARDMVIVYGMGEVTGHISYYKNYNFISEQTKREIDLEIKNIVEECYEKCKKLLTEHKDKLIAVAEKLLIEETLDARTVYEMVGVPFPQRLIDKERLKKD